MKIQKSGVNTDCSQHQDFKHINLHLAMPKLNLQYINLKVKVIPVL